MTTHSLILSPQKCINCGQVIPVSAPCLTTRRGPVCMGCEFKEIEVFTMSEGGDVYYDKAYSSFIEMLKDQLNTLDTGYQLTIGKRAMRALHYFDLPEWQGA